MTIYETVDGATAEVMRAFWSAVTIVAEQAQVTEADAMMHMRRSVTDRVKAAKPTELVDYTPDGRSALWRVRLTIWTGNTADDQSLFADTDAPHPYERPGSTLIQGLPGVAEWAWDLIQQAHPGAAFQDISGPIIKHKLRTLRVALSNQGGEVVWRLRYVAEPAAGEPGQMQPGSLRGVRTSTAPRPFLAIVRVSQEAPAVRHTRT